MARRLEVQIVGDSTSLERAFAKSSRSAAKFQRDMSRAGRAGGRPGGGPFMGDVLKGMVAFAGATTAFEVMKEGVQGAVDLQKQVQRLDVVFGESSKSIEDWSKTTAESMGVSERAAVTAAGAFGALFKPMNVTAGQAAQMSETMTQLAADLASFKGGTFDEAFRAVQSALAGMSRGLKRYGVLITAAMTTQQAMADTGKTNAASLTEQEKVMARYELILEHTKLQQGNFARTQGTAANQAKKFHANIEDLKDALGTGLIPMLVTAAKRANQLIEVLKKAGSVQLPSQKGGGGGSIGKLVGFLDKPIWTQAIDQFKTMGQMLGIIDENAQGAAGSMDAFEAATHAATTLTQGLKPGTFSDLPGVTPFRGHPVNITNAQRNQFRDARLARMIDRVQDIPTLQGQIKRLREISALVQKWIDAAKDVTRKQTLQDDLLQIQRDILSDQEQIASDAADAASRAAEKQKELAQKRHDALVARQFGILGLGPTGEDPIPGMKALRRQLARVADHLKGTELDTRGNRSLLQRIRKALDFKSLEPEVRQKIRELLQGIQDEFKQGGDHILRFRKLQPDAFINQLGLGLTPQQRRRLRQGLAGVGPGGTVAAPSSAFALAHGAVFNGPVTFNGVQDVKAMEHALAKRTKARSHQRRGAR